MILIVAALNEMWKYQIRKSEHQSSKLGLADRATIENDNANMFGAQVGQISHLKYLKYFVMQRNVYMVGLSIFLALALKRVTALILSLAENELKYKELKNEVII